MSFALVGAGAGALLHRDRYYTGGLAANAQVFFTPIMEFGLGLDAYANLNPQMSVAGLRLVLIIEGYK